MQLSLIEQALLIIMISGLMIGIGSSISKNEIIELKHHKLDFLIALVLQYIMMPCWAIVLGKTLNLPTNISFTLLLIACCPSGTTSNMFTYFSKGNVSFSLALTTLTSLLAFFMTPLLLSFYAKESRVDIPAANIFATVSLTLIPIFIGFFININSKSWGSKVNRYGNFMGHLAVFIMILIWTPKILNVMRDYETVQFLRIGVMSLVAIFFTAFICFVIRRPFAESKTIALETGIQNAPLAFLIVQVNYTQELVDEVGWVPLVYGALSVVSAIIFTLASGVVGYYQTQKR